MEELKFRVWDKKRNIMRSSRHDILMLTLNGDLFWHKGHKELHPVKQDIYILMQYVGVKDMNGVEIYESDIVKNERGEVGIIIFTNGSFVSQYVSPHNWDIMEPADGCLDKQTIIGNIYNNRKFLEEK